jgi:hypothetical protein
MKKVVRVPVKKVKTEQELERERQRQAFWDYHNKREERKNKP